MHSIGCRQARRRDPALPPTPRNECRWSAGAILEANHRDLAQAGEWDAVHLRLANEVRPLEFRISGLAENIDREVAQERAQAVLAIAQAQRRILLIVPLTVVLVLLFAALLGMAVTRSITQPLGKLVEASKALGQGQFRHRVAVSGSNELAHLGRSFQ